MSEANKTVVRRYLEELLNQEKLALVDELFAEDSVIHVLHMLEARGLEARRQFVTTLRTISPDGHYTIEDLIGEGEKVVVRWTWVGTHQGTWMGIAPTGKRVSLRGTTTMRVVGGKIVEEYSDWDALAYLQQVGAAPQSTEANKALALRFFDGFLNNHDLALADEIFAADIAYRGPHLPEIRGTEATKQLFIAYQAGFPDNQYATEEPIAEGNKVVVRWTATATHKGEWMGVAPTGNPISVTGTTTLRIAGGKIVDHWADWDALGLFQQIGAVLPLGQGKGQAAG